MAKKKIVRWVFRIGLTAVIAGCAVYFAEVPQKDAKGELIRPWREVHVGGLESEDYYFYTEQMDAMAQVLQEEGWIRNYSGVGNTGEEVWSELSAAAPAKGLTFAEDAFCNMEDMSEEALEGLKSRKDVDLLLAFGTAAGEWLTKNREELPFDYMVFGAADPVTAGLVPDENNRYSDRAFVHVDAKRTGRQIDMAYRLFAFKDIGVVYEDSPAAYSYSGIRQLEERSEAYGFRIHTLHVDEPKNQEDYERYYRELKAAYGKLISQIDVLYITTGKIQDEKLPWLLEEVHGAGVVTVAETQESQVQNGAMIHITMSDPQEEGIFAGKTVGAYAAGTPLKELDQNYEITPKIVLNYHTAKILQVKIPMTIYLIADRIYDGNGEG